MREMPISLKEWEQRSPDTDRILAGWTLVMNSPVLCNELTRSGRWRSWSLQGAYLLPQHPLWGELPSARFKSLYS